MPLVSLQEHTPMLGNRGRQEWANAGRCFHGHLWKESQLSRLQKTLAHMKRPPGPKKSPPHKKTKML